MAPKDKYPTITDEGFETLCPVPSVLSLGQPPEIEHHRDTARGREFIKIDDSVEYPRDIPPDHPLTDVVLRQVHDDPDIYGLPADYISVPHALNEASGAVTITDVHTGRPNAGKKTFETIFRAVGSTVSDLLEQAHMVPDELHYERMILERTEKGAKVRLLPPAHFTELSSLDESRAALERTRETLETSLADGATNPMQRYLSKVAMQAYDQAVIDNKKRNRHG